jgi:hypothetical protein
MLCVIFFLVFCKIFYIIFVLKLIMSPERKTMSQQEAEQFVLRNKYPVSENNSLITRCIDGRYDRVEGLPALAIPGADAGQMCVIFSALRSRELQFDQTQVFDTLVDVVGGVSNLKFHKDDHEGNDSHLAGCGYVGQITKDPQAFGLTSEDVEFTKQKANFAIENGAQEVVLSGEHLESAILILFGNYSVYPKDEVDLNNILQTFVFHQSLSENRNKVIAKKLIENKVVSNISEDELYELLTKSTNLHLSEIANRLAKGLPTYKIRFEDDGRFNIE